MSHSPLDDKELSGLIRYKQGWKALNRLIHENKSFSGRETNSAFLNTGENGRFADISTAIGWDFADDARAIGLVDCDCDGDLDLWVSNRTGPRVRFLKNRLNAKAGFLSLHLGGNGKTTNRDGIGSRVEVHLKGEKTPLIRTLHAGQSFLSQSSRWLHFGLGEKSQISHVVVHWPGGNAETFTEAKSGGFFYLFQGTGKALPRKSTPDISLPLADHLPTPETPLARTIVPPGHAMPPINDFTIEGTSLIALWSHTCPHCRDELTAWAENSSEWSKNGIKVLALSADLEDRDACEAFLKKLGNPFDLVMATINTVESLDALQASLVDLWIPIPVPTSFLVSKEGEVLAIYRGPVDQAQVIADSDLATMSPEERRAYGTPFKGTWVDDPTSGNPRRTANQLVERAQIGAAIDYLKLALSKPFLEGTDLDKGDNQLLLGQLLGRQGRASEAIAPLKKAQEFLPDDIRVLRLLAAGYLESNRAPKALEVLKDARIKHPDNLDLLIDSGKTATANGDLEDALGFFDLALKQAPNRVDTRFHCAEALLLAGQPQEAVAHYKSILGTHPRIFEAADQLARVLSTHPDDSVRSPREALALATRLCQITKNQNANFLLTYALANANLGNFAEADKILQQLKKLRPPTAQFSTDLEGALESVSRKQPIRNTRWKSSK